MPRNCWVLNNGGKGKPVSRSSIVVGFLAVTLWVIDGLFYARYGSDAQAIGIYLFAQTVLCILVAIFLIPQPKTSPDPLWNTRVPWPGLFFGLLISGTLVFLPLAHDAFDHGGVAYTVHWLALRLCLGAEGLVVVGWLLCTYQKEEAPIPPGKNDPPA